MPDTKVSVDEHSFSVWLGARDGVGADFIDGAQQAWAFQQSKILAAEQRIAELETVVTKLRAAFAPLQVIEQVGSKCMPVSIEESISIITDEIVGLNAQIAALQRENAETLKLRNYAVHLTHCASTMARREVAWADCTCGLAKLLAPKEAANGATVR